MFGRGNIESFSISGNLIHSGENALRQISNFLHKVINPSQKMQILSAASNNEIFISLLRFTAFA
jgi:hypothetical protein